MHLTSTLPCTTSPVSGDSDISQPHHVEHSATMTEDKLGEVSVGEAHIDIHRGEIFIK